MKKTFVPIKDKCGEIVEFIMSTPEMPAQEDLLFKIRLSVEEVVENVVQYAYANGDGFLGVETEIDGNGLLTITLTDAGKPFDPLAKDDPDITLSAEERQIGGLGIFLTKQMMDEVRYKYENGCNILTLKKQCS
ncbi:MAG: ATP-binding protein [Bacteroidales bacterium]|nr:ATP-binding protein [Bacteroidales bacterium]